MFSLWKMASWMLSFHKGHYWSSFFGLCKKQLGIQMKLPDEEPSLSQSSSALSRRFWLLCCPYNHFWPKLSWFLIFIILIFFILIHYQLESNILRLLFIFWFILTFLCFYLCTIPLHFLSFYHIKRTFYFFQVPWCLLGLNFQTFYNTCCSDLSFFRSNWWAAH